MKPVRRWHLKAIVVCCLFTGLQAGVSHAQIGQPDTLAVPDTPPNPPDLNLARDTIPATGDGPGSPQTTANTRDRTSPGEAIRFTASDSLTFRVKGVREARLFGSAKVEHTSGELTSGIVTLNLSENLMSAEALVPGDTLSEPLLRRGEDVIRSERILYNYRTEKGKFYVARVSMDKGSITGTEVKRAAPHVIFIRDGIYSTCDLDHPHYYLKAARMKVVDEDEVFFTRARLYILDIPYPFVFPFGYIPSRLDRRRSGLLEPTYSFQQQNARGLGLQGLGWFQYFNDYITSTFQGDIFTSGTFLFNNRTQYQYKRDFGGSIDIGYSLDRGLEPTDPDFSTNIQKRLGIQHNQTLNPYANLSANINLSTSEFNRRNSYDPNERANTSTTSRVGLNYRHPEGAYTFGTNLSLTQNFRNNSVNMTGPTSSFSIRRRTPFQPQVRRANPRWYESVSYGYSNRFDSRFNFVPLTTADPDISWWDALMNPSLYRQATNQLGHVNYGLTHQADATAQLIPSDFANLTASVRVNEYWYPETVEKRFDPEENRVITEIDKGFATARDFNTSLSLGTTIYGISNAKIRDLEGFRHTMRPSVSYNYRPDFSKEFWGYYRTVQSDTLGNTQRYSRFERGIYGGPAGGEQQAISFSVDNVFETKQVRRDSTGERRERIIRLIDNLRAGVSYNFVAPTFKLSDLNTSMTSSFVPGVNINVSAVFSFYDTDSTGRVIPQYLWDNDNGYLRPTRFSVRASTQFSSGGMQGGRGFGGSSMAPPPYYPRFYDPLDQSVFRAYDDMFQSEIPQTMNVPWSVSLSFDYSWSKINNNTQRNVVVNAQSIQFRITPEWQASTSLGYDFIQKRMTPSAFNITRNLHCWDLSFQWNPFGDFKYYMFRLSVRDSQIQGLFQKLPGLNNLERSNSPINRRGFY